MDIFSTWIDSSTFQWIVIPLLIFLARIVDVTLGTVRIIYIARGIKLLAPLFGFFEILIWLVAITQIMQNLTNPLYYFAYAAGFATGNLVGMFMEERLAVGKVILRAIMQKDAYELIRSLRASGFGVTAVDAEGASGPVTIIFTIVNREDVETILGRIHRYNPRAFYSIEDVRHAEEGIFRPSKRFSDFVRLRRKG